MMGQKYCSNFHTLLHNSEVEGGESPVALQSCNQKQSSEIDRCSGAIFKNGSFPLGGKLFQMKARL